MDNIRLIKIPELKPIFLERIKELFPNKEDLDKYLEILKHPPVKSIRSNPLKIPTQELKQRLEKRGWIIKQPYIDYPEIMIIENELKPGELGRAEEHLLGYYYIQELASMFPIIALKPKKGEYVLDLCSSPGSKTTQTAAEMQNTGAIIANEISLARIKILAANLERCGVTNALITRKEGASFCNKFEKLGIKFDKILLDAPCSGEGTLRSTYKTYEMWNPKTIKALSHTQKKLFEAAFSILKIGGEMIYSTCTHAPEENEEIVNFALETFKDKIKMEKIILPKEVIPKPGILKWQKKEYSKQVELSCRIYPQDNNTEGFFIAKFRRVK